MFSYSFHADDGFTSSNRNGCPSGYGESMALHCDIGFYASAAEKAVVVQIANGDGGAILLSQNIPLKPFNYCGNGIAQVVATTSDAGVPQLIGPQYVNACGSL